MKYLVQYEDFLDFLLNHARKLFSPEEWISIDLSLSKTEIFCLLWMSKNHEVIMSDIAGFLDIPMSTTTGVVNRLVKKGYLERYRSETDRRIVVITLTEEGHQLVKEVRAAAAHYFKLVTEMLTEEEKVFLLQIFKKIVKQIADKELEGKKQAPLPKIKHIPIQ